MVSIRTSPGSSSPKVTASRLGRVLHVTEEAVNFDSVKWLYFNTANKVVPRLVYSRPFVVFKTTKAFSFFRIVRAQSM